MPESCRARRRKVLESIVEAVDLAVELDDDVVATSPDAVDVADPLFDELTGPLANTRVEFLSLTSQLYDLETLRDKAKLEYEKLSKKVPADVKSSEEQIGAEQDGAHPRYHGVWRSIGRIVEANGESNAGHADMLSQLHLLLENGGKVKAVSSLSDPP